MKILSQLSLLALATSVSHGAVIGINFGTERQTEATASYSSTELGVTVSTWNYDGGPNGNDWSGNGTTFTADGATVGIWHDAEGTWQNGGVPESSVLHGYLDDTQGNNPGDNQNYIHLTGLSAWLSNVGATSYKVTVLRSSDNATGWDPIEVKTGNVAGESGWLNNNDPTGATVDIQPNIPAIDFGAAQARTYETPAIEFNANGLALHYLSTGGTGANPRGSVAGIIIQSVPEPSSALLFGLGGLALILRRRR